MGFETDKFFQCSLCGGIFDKEWDNEVAEAEYKKNFPDDAKANVPKDVVCDNCYKLVMDWKEKGEDKQDE